MAQAWPNELPSALGFALFENGPEGELRLVEPVPEWFRRFGAAAGGGAFPLGEAFPFLEIFLPDAEDFWRQPEAAPLYSDVWTQADETGAERHLRAAAVAAGGRGFLVIECPEGLYGETRGLVQHAHDTALRHDRIAKLSRALEAANQLLEERNREVERATNAKSEFLARMSHEIRTPLNAILGMADLLWESGLGGAQREYVRISRRAGENLLNLINDILDLSKVEAGHLQLDQAPFDLVEVLEKAAEIAAIKAHAKGLELICDIAPLAATNLVGDPDRLRQVIINLLGNAVKFTARGEIAVRVEPDPDGPAPEYLRFAVSDTGIGIPADKLEAVFESFTQADVSTSRQYGGTGLGLAICRKFVELMGGRIWVESEPGAGSTFCFTASFGAGPAVSAPAAELAGKRCLVADDSAGQRRAVRNLLAVCGAAAAEVPGGLEALAELKAARRVGRPYDLALLDARMPGRDGFEVADEVRRDPGLAGMVLLMVTTESPADAARCRAAGVRPVLKPLRRSELLDCVRMRAAAESVPAVSSDAAALTGVRILLADDSEDNRFLIRNYLRQTGCELVEAEDGRIAVRRFQESRFSLVLLDVQMPEMDGYTATRTIRAWETANGACRTPILALTAHALKEEAQKSIDAGCDAHLTKPIQKKTLLDAIGRYAVRENADAATDAPAPTPITIDASLEDIVPGYLENRRRDVAAIAAALDGSDFQKIRVLGHNMKGSGAGYGMPAITEIGAALEEAAKQADAARVRVRLEELGRFLKDVEISYE